jgi:iron(III) transport system substrate-binding protein
VLEPKTMKRSVVLLATLWSVVLLSPVQGAESSWESQWTETLAKARQEGVVAIGTTQTTPEFREGMTKLFTGRFGIRVDVRAGRATEVVTIAGRECAAGRPSMDVMLSGLADILTLYPKGCLAPIKPTLILPEVTNPKNWRDGFLKWNDPNGEYFLQTTEYVEGWTIINKDRLKPTEVALAKDFLKPAYKNKIASHDPRQGGPGQATATFLLVTFGEDYVRRLYSEHGVVYTGDYRQLADWIAKGVYWIGLGQISRPIEPLRKEGLPIEVVTHKDFPGFLSGGGGVLKLLKNSPHPNAATILLNWLASKEGQELFSDVSEWPSRRVDVSRKDLPDYLFPKPGVKYHDNFEYKFYTEKRPEVSKKLIDLLGR